MNSMSDNKGEFSVCQFFSNGQYEYFERFVPIERAMEAAHHCCTSVGARVGITSRVIITDGSDAVNFEWTHGEVVIFPPDLVAATGPGWAMNSQNLVSKMEDVERKAFSGCGLSDVLYETRVQDGYASILAQAPESERAATEAALRARGYDPDFTPYQAGDGECSLTGIYVDCCPCGQHL